MTEKQELLAKWFRSLDTDLNHQDTLLEANETFGALDGQITLNKWFKIGKIKGKPCVINYLFSSEKCEHFSETEPCKNTDCPNHYLHVKWLAAKQNLDKAREDHDAIVASRKQAWKEYRECKR